jgi:hypothetical protein
LEYTSTGARMARRAAGLEERPPVGIAALPQTVLPDLYGSVRTGSVRLAQEGEVESSAAAYCGVVASLLLAPLAWHSRRHRAFSLLWIGLSFLALSWCLDVPGIVSLLRLPGLNMMSHNRLVFVASFATLALAAVGLEVFSQGPVPWRWWCWVPAALLAALAGWCVYRSLCLPERIASGLESAVRHGGIPEWWIHNLGDVHRARAWFVHHYLQAALLCGTGAAGWVLVWFRRPWQARLLPLLGALLVGDLLCFAYGRSSQCDQALYFPPVPVLEQVAKAEPGRIIGFNCLPASLAAMCGLRDIRGYDSVDPASLMALMAIAGDSRSTTPDYALTQWLIPQIKKTPEGGIRLSPLFDMLGVRYIIFRKPIYPDARAAFEGADYWVLTNPTAFPRAFVPRKVEVVPDKEARLAKLTSPRFDPAAVAYVESPVQLPDSCRGAVELAGEIPTRVSLSARMETPGLVVLADLWDKGWRACLDGKPVPILRVNHALRGVIVPAGTSKLEFRYEPASFAWGLRLSCLAAAVLIGWVGLILRLRQTRTRRS